MKKSIISCLLILSISIFVSGCGKIQLFESKTDPYLLVAKGNKELKQEIFYVKDGTKFYKTLKPNATFSSKSMSVDPKRIIWLGKDESLIPTLYKGESIAYASKVANLDSVILERFKYEGYSVGAYLVEYDFEKNMINMTVGSNSIEGTSMHKVLSNAKSKYIRVEALNDTPVNSAMINESGIFTCLEENATYEFCYYAGTYYTKSQVQADTKYLTSYEIFKIDSIEDTKNGYVSISLPEEMESGYYLIDGAGLFKYIAHEKGTVEESSLDYNIATNKAEVKESVNTNSQAYAITLKEEMVNQEFRIEYEDDQGIDVSAVLVSPNGDTYELQGDYIDRSGMNTSDKTQQKTCTLASVIKGQWTMYITPADLKVNIEMINTSVTIMAQTKEYSTNIEGKEYAEFMVEYEGSNNTQMLAILTDPNGKIYNFNPAKKSLRASLTEVPNGLYTVKVYYFDYATTLTNAYVNTKDESGNVITEKMY